MVALFLKSLIIGYSGAVMPGSMLTYTVDRSIRHGSKTGFFLSIGHALLELVLLILIFIGVGKYLATDLARLIIGLIGGIVLVYLGFEMLRDVYLNKVSLDIKDANNDRQENILLSGVILSVTNPYFIIWWSVVGLSLIMSSYNSFGIIGIIIFYIGHILSDISWFSFVSVIVSKTRHLISIKVYKIIIVILALCLIFFSVGFFFDSVKYFL
ncbi:LysE family transporter [Iocasia frigidifontis]|uniref:LysE family transporter n=1 Tax=Iocasia fonsfrigidae TaxID=2682810 RepID=A0A8A7KIH2_9FIRM|nr:MULTISPECIES: LysE family transporter [Halanaerobiaceae]AZO95783.1 lysine transporter LysE [Halocella sp. SP3-1]QTL98647.1 LysE family transporter [Iocasia fonsfrigidae]